jgi:hypothetical protein
LNDDHPQYLLANGARALTGAFNASGNRVTGLGAATAPTDALRFDQAVKPGDAAAGDLEGSYPSPAVVALRGRPVSATAPTASQVLTWSGTIWEPRNATTGVTDHGQLTGLLDDDHQQYLLGNGVREAVNGFAVTGTLNSGVIPVEGGGTLLMWYPRKAAFRAGDAFQQWNDASIGPGSAAMGIATTASGRASIAMGNVTTASGDFSTSFGHISTASGYQSTAIGWGTTASGYTSTAMGAITTASGSFSTAMGDGTVASGVGSTAIGRATTAQAWASLVIGQYNMVEGNQQGWVPTDPLFVAGNGSGTDLRANALTLFKNGNLTIAGTLAENSDIRLKEDVQPLGDVLARVLQLDPIRYRFRAGTGHPAEPKVGLSAQAVEPLFPELVRSDAAGYLSVAYADLAAVLVRAIQEQHEQFAALRAELTELRRQLAHQAGSARP